MTKTAEIPVTNMKDRAYVAIFGVEPIASNETIIDVGSGRSRLGGVVPEGRVIQVDPIYGSVEDYDNMSFVRLGLGRPDAPRTREFRGILDAEATRVTSAHMLHHLHGERKLLAVEQILHLAQFGIAQFYPVYARKAAALESARQRRADLLIARPHIRALGQVTFIVTGINRTLSVLDMPDRMTTRDRKKLAELIVPAIV